MKTEKLIVVFTIVISSILILVYVYTGIEWDGDGDVQSSPEESEPRFAREAQEVDDESTPRIAPKANTSTPQTAPKANTSTPRIAPKANESIPRIAPKANECTDQQVRWIKAKMLEEESFTQGKGERAQKCKIGTRHLINDCVLTPWVIGECDEETGEQHATRSGTGNCTGVKMSKYEDCCKTTPWVDSTGCVNGTRKFTRTIKNCPREYKTVKYESCKTIGKWYGGDCGKDGKRYFGRFNWNAPELPTKKVEDCCYMSDWKLNGTCGDDAMGNFTRTIGSKCEDNTPTTKRDKCCKVFGWTPKGSCVNGKQKYTRVVKNNDLCPSTGYKTSMVQDCCNVGGWKKSGECKAGGQIYVRSVQGYCPENPKNKKIEACCTPGNWIGTGKCDGEYEEQYRSLTKGCSSTDTPKTRSVITTFCKDAEAARKLKEKKRLDDAEKARLVAIERERSKALAIKQQKAKEAPELEERKRRNLVKAAGDAQKKAQECADKSWNGTNLSYNDYHEYITKDQTFAGNTKHGTIKIDVTMGKRCVGRSRGRRCSGPTVDDYSTTKTVISLPKYDWRGNSVGYQAVKTYEGRLIMYKGKLILVKYLTLDPRGRKKYELIAKFQKVDKHAVVLVSHGGKNHVLFIKNDGTRSYDLINGKWIDHPYAKC